MEKQLPLPTLDQINNDLEWMDNYIRKATRFYYLQIFACILLALTSFWCFVTAVIIDSLIGSTINCIFSFINFVFLMKEINTYIPEAKDSLKIMKDTREKAYELKILLEGIK